MSNTAVVPVASECDDRHLGTLEEIHEALEDLGYQSKVQDESLSVNVNRGVVASIIADQDELTVCCHLTTLGRLLPDDAEQAAAVCAHLMRHNVAISPFAISLIADEDDEDPEDDPVALIDSVPLGNFSLQELKKLMENLNKAVASTGKLVSELVEATKA